MVKAMSGHWAKLDIPPKVVPKVAEEEPVMTATAGVDDDNESDVDLDDLEAMRGVQITELPDVDWNNAKKLKIMYKEIE